MSVRIHSFPMSHLRSAETLWLWQHYVPLGSVITLEGHPGIGKSAFALWLTGMVTQRNFHLEASRITSPDERLQLHQPLNVGLIMGEDHPTTTIRPRLEKLGADPNRVHFLDMVKTESGIQPVQLDQHFHLLQQFIHENRIQLLVIDPWLAFVPSHVASCESRVRVILQNLRLMAESRRCTVLIIRHLAKKFKNHDEVLGASGCVGVSALCRAVLRMETTPNKDHVQLRVIKTNLGEKPSAQFFHWKDNVLQRDETHQPTHKETTNHQLTQALHCLTQHDLSTEPVSLVKNSLQEAGISLRHYWQALEHLGWTVVRKNDKWCYEKLTDDNPNPN